MAHSLEIESIQCRGCGASLAYAPGSLGLRCDHCGGSYAAPLEVPAAEEGDFQVVPVVVDKKAAKKIFNEWFRPRFWQPGDLRQRARVKSIMMLYAPFWAFSARVTSSWSGCDLQTRYRTVTKSRTRYGSGGKSYEENYTDSEPYTVEVGRNGTHTADWTRLVNASEMALGPFVDRLGIDIRDGRPLGREYLVGWDDAPLTVGQPEAWEEARERFRLHAIAVCGSFVDRLDHVDSVVDRRSASLVWYPFWFVTYAYEGKTYPLVIDGKTGRAIGSMPINATKSGVAAGLSIIGMAVFAVATFCFGSYFLGSPSLGDLLWGTLTAVSAWACWKSYRAASARLGRGMDLL